MIFSFPITTVGQAASKAPLGTLFNAGSGAIALGLTATNVFALVNPSGSGKSLYVGRIVLASAIQSQCQRIRVAGGTWTGTALAEVNRLMGSGTTAVGVAWGSPVLTGGTSVNDVIRFNADKEDCGGDLIIAPGYALMFAMLVTLASIPIGSVVSAAVDVSWWEQ